MLLDLAPPKQNFWVRQYRSVETHLLGLEAEEQIMQYAGFLFALQFKHTRKKIV